MIEKTFTFNAGAQFAPGIVGLDSAGQAVYHVSGNYHVVSLATTNAASVKGSIGRVWNVSAVNVSATDRYVKLYNKATAPVPGTDTPMRTIKVPANGVASISLASPMYMALGIGVAITAGAADTDSAAVAAGDVILDIDFA